jgi:transcriptional regulator with XRE-family HTH domain
MSEQVDDRLTRAEYAKYKRVTKQMVSKWIRDNRVVLTIDEKFILVKESDERIKLTASLNGSFYDRKAKEEKEIINKIIDEKGFTELTEEVNRQQLDLEIDDAEILFKNARALKEKAAALQAAAEHEAYIGSLMEKKAAEKIIFERGRQFRDGLMSLSRKLAPEIAGNPDITEVEGILNSEFRLILENFANLPPVE